jgi:tetratricopeptide (TPR) repeat protein
VYGRSLNHAVVFNVFDAFCAAAGFDLLRTTSAAATMHTAALRLGGPHAPPVREAFDELFVSHHASQDLLDFSAAAQRFAETEDALRAMRFLDRALELDPYHPELYLRMGNACVAAGQVTLGLQYLTEGQALDHWRVHDFDFYVAAAHAHAGDLRAAIASYQRSLAREVHPATLNNLGRMCELLGDSDGACHWYRRTQRVDADNATARERLDALKQALWERELARIEREESRL